MNNIKLYDIHGPTAISNYKPLLTSDGKYFYWDNKQFKKNVKGDKVFWVNRTVNECLYTEIDETELSSTFKDGQNRIVDQSYDLPFYSQGNSKYEIFYSFKVIEKVLIPDIWSYTDSSTFANQLMAYKLYEIDIDKPQSRISKLNDLKGLFTKHSEAYNLIEEAVGLLQDGTMPNPVKSSIKPELNTESAMNILTAIKTKPFILLAGISGTGKSRLARTLAYKTCAKKDLQTDIKKPGNFELIPVRPNWHDSSELMGYVSRINGEKYITTSFLQFISKAWKHLDTPFFLCLDEMNLAPVEQYFAEYLSIVETRQLKENKIATDYLLSKSSFENQNLYNQILKDLGLEIDSKFKEGIGIPNNLVVIGTVNMDETTHSFSRKVLDRAMTFEMNVVNLNAGLDEKQNDWSYPKEFTTSDEVIGEYTAGSEVVNRYPESNQVIEFLQKINIQLEGSPFKIAYRVRDEFLIYCYYASQTQDNTNWLQSALDEMTSMKILSRIEGDETKTGTVLKNLQKVLTSDFKKSNSKLKEMETRLQNCGYTSFWS